MEKTDFGGLLPSRDARTEAFLESLDTLRADIRRIVENCRPSLGGERFLTDKELSERLSVSRRTLHEWRTDEVIGYIQLGGKILYRESEILRLIEKNYHKPYGGI